MKHLKRYNEELNPETYKNAGRSLISKGHEKRGVNLLTYGHEKANDILNFWVGLGDYAQVFTNPIEASYVGARVRFSQHKSSTKWGNNYHSIGGNFNPDFWDRIINDVVSSYKDGGVRLYLDIQLYFTISPRQVSQFKSLSNKIARRITAGSETGISDQTFINGFASEYRTYPLMTFRLHLSDYISWDYEDENGMNTIKPTEDEIYDMFENMYRPSFFTIEGEPTTFMDERGNDTRRTIMATLSSRKDANKFKSMVMPKVIESLKPLLHSLFSEEIQTTPENYEKAINVMKNLKTNSIYKDEINTTIKSTKEFRNKFINYY